MVLMDLEEGAAIRQLFALERPRKVVHPEAQAGWGALHNRDACLSTSKSKLVGFGHLLEGFRHQVADHLVYASSSLLYGGNHNFPFSQQQPVNDPLSLYEATKKSTAIMAHIYSHIYGLPARGLCFFTVYALRSRPGMASMLFARAKLAGDLILVFNDGQMRRYFTFIDKIVKVCVSSPQQGGHGVDL